MMDYDPPNFEAFASKAISAGMSAQEIYDRLVKAMATIALMRHFGHETKAAKELGVHRNTLIRWMQIHQLRIEVFRR